MQVDTPSRQGLGVRPREWSGLRGALYERDTAMAVYQKNKKKRLVFYGEKIPDALIAIADGLPVDADRMLAEKRHYMETVRRDLSMGQVPKRRKISSLFGMDGISVDRKAWEGSGGDIDLHVLEAKVGLADCNVLGPSISRRFKALSRVGNEKMPPLILLSPHSPTPAVFDTFSVIPNSFKFVEIPEDGSDAVSVAAARGAPQAKIEPFKWQKRLQRKANYEWDPECTTKPAERIVTMEVVMGLGKTVAAWTAMKPVDKDKEKRPLKILCTNTIVVGRQAIEEAESLGIHAHNLTCTGKLASLASEGVEAKGGLEDPDDVEDVEYSEEVEDVEYSEEMDDTGELLGPEERELERDADKCAKKNSQKIIGELKRLSDSASNDSPVYVVICHATLRAIAKDLASAITCRAVMTIDEVHKLKHSKDVFSAILSKDVDLRSLLMTASPPEYKASELGEEVAAALKRAPCVCKLGMKYGIATGRLVPLHIETAVALDLEKNEVIEDTDDMPIANKIKATAAWIVANNLSTVSIYTTRTDHADDFATDLSSEIEELSGGKAWVRSVHSGKRNSENSKTLDEFKKDSFDNEGVSYKAVVSVAQLREGFNMPKLDGVVLVSQPTDDETLLQIIGRVMRASEGKTIGRALVFGSDASSTRISKMIYKYDSKRVAVSVGVVADSYAGHAKSVNNPDLKRRMKRKMKVIKGKVEDEVKRIAYTFLSVEDGLVCKAQALARACPDKRPSEVGGDVIDIVFNGISLGKKQACVCLKTDIRARWNVDLPNEAKEVMLALPWFEPPPAEKRKVSSGDERVDELIEFVKTNGFTPSRGKDAEDESEKKLGMFWSSLQNVANKTSIAYVKRHGEGGWKAVVEKVSGFPSRVYLHQIDTFKAILKACISRRGSDKPWPSQREPGGTFLDNIRGGDMSEAVFDRGVEIARSVLNDKRDAKALEYIEASIQLGIERRPAAREANKKRLAERRSKKRKAEASDSEPASKRKVGESSSAPSSSYTPDSETG